MRRNGFALDAGSGSAGRGSLSGGQEGGQKIGSLAVVDGTIVEVGGDGAVGGKLRLSGVGCIRAAGGEVNIGGWAVGRIAFFSQVRIEEVEGRQGGGPMDGEEGGGRVRRGSVRETVLCVCGARGGGGMGGRCCGC